MASCGSGVRSPNSRHLTADTPTQRRRGSADGDELGGPMRVLVAAPIDLASSSTTSLVRWADAARREVQAVGDVPLFAVCGAASPGAERPAPAPSLRSSGIGVLVVERAASSVRAAMAGSILERVRLAREAAEARADVLWFLDPELVPPDGTWKALRAELAAGAGGALVAHPLDAMIGGAPAVIIIGKNAAGASLLAMVDARSCRPEPGRASYPVIGGGMGCLAIPIHVFLVVKFAIGEIDVEWATPSAASGGGVSEKAGKKKVVSGEAVGWYMNAVRQKVPIRALADRVCSALLPGFPG